MLGAALIQAAPSIKKLAILMKKEFDRSSAGAGDWIEKTQHILPDLYQSHACIPLSRNNRSALDILTYLLLSSDRSPYHKLDL